MNAVIRNGKNWGGALCGAGLMAVLAWQLPAASAESAVVIPAPLVDDAPAGAQVATAVFAGGCFWGVQGVFEHVRGVSKVLSGYAGGAASTAQYRQVGSGTTGHAESVQITYDPAQVSYGKLLQVFFSVAHNPTELNRQGPDSGTQYRSAIFPLTAQQRTIAQKYVAQLNGAHAFQAPLATRIEDTTAFYPAEAYHQDYLTLHPDDPYIVVNDLPKVAALKQTLPGLYRAKAVLVNPG